jgi:hypothetical protein
MHTNLQEDAPKDEPKLAPALHRPEGAEYSTSKTVSPMKWTNREQSPEDLNLHIRIVRRIEYLFSNTEIPPSNI